jgi:hypothetical protein
MPTRATLTTTTPVASSDESNGYATFASTTVVSLTNQAGITVMSHLDTSHAARRAIRTQRVDTADLQVSQNTSVSGVGRP